MALFFFGSNGTNDRDYFLPISSGQSILNGNGGSDLILGDFPDNAGSSVLGNNSIATAFNRDSSAIWGLGDIGIVTDGATIPHVTMYVEGEAGTQEFFSVRVNAGETLTADTDFSTFDTVISLFLPDGTFLGTNNDFATDAGSQFSSGDSFLNYTNNSGSNQIIIVRVGQFEGGQPESSGNLDGTSDTTLLHLSVTNHAFSTDFIEGDDILNGGAGDDLIYGTGGDDILEGGAGDDILNGGADSDTASYSTAGSGVTVDLAFTTQQNTGGGGLDTLESIENLTGSGHNDTLIGDTNINTLTGGAGNDGLYGFEGADTLNGDAGDDVLWGGLGDDTMSGGADNDTYLVEQTGDTVTELADEGNDTVYAFVNHTLADNVEIGVSFNSDMAYTLDGNALDNVLIVNSAEAGSSVNGGGGNDVIYVQSNTLTFGGADNDTLVFFGNDNTAVGGDGDDVYIVQGTGTVITEVADEGTDTQYSSLTEITLAANVEILVLLANNANGTGNAQDNTIIGNGTANTLMGMDGVDFLIGGGGDDMIEGGVGADVMQGNAGMDTFIYNATNELGDFIQDWVAADDGFVFTAAAFGFTAGQMLIDGTNFISGTNPLAALAEATFLWDSDDTALYFDADGTGAGEAVLVADLQAFTDMSVADFTFV